jgi:acyl-CoA synthetase (AMP-forming)/AMP-acid ligase II
MAAAVLRSRHPTPTLRRIVVGGGPVTSLLCERVLRAFPHADAEIAYGATEAEPIATISMSEALVARGRGYVVGRPVAATEVVIAGPEGACSTEGVAEAGEVLVRGRHVIGADGAWHRTGDVGTIDGRGRLWLLGRLGWSVRHRGVELHPYVVEAELHRIDGVRAAALVAHAGAPRGEVAVCVDDGTAPVAIECAVRARLESLGAASIAVRICAEIPMDARHASKVAREVLARRLARGGR